MTGKEIIGYINDGANYYVSLFGKAQHMNCVIKDNYSYIFPKEGEKGITFVYDVKIDDLDEMRKMDIIEEIKSLKMPVWWDLRSVKSLYKTLFGEEKIIGTVDDEEPYMALLPGEEKLSKDNLSNISIKKVDNQELFKIWANHINEILSNGYPDIHPEYHYNLCRDSLMDCFLGFIGENIVTSATIMNNNGIASLEFIATNPKYRRKGLAKQICSHAIAETFLKGAKIITVRAINETAKKLYENLGFKIYNQMM